MCGKDCPCQQSGFRARRNARLGYAATCATETETTANSQFAFEAEPFEFDPTTGEWETDEWEAENEGEAFETALYDEMSDEARWRRRPAASRYGGRSFRPRRRAPRPKPAFRKFPKWPFRFPLPRVAGGSGAVIVGQPAVEEPPATEPPPDSEPPYTAEPPANTEPAADGEPGAAVEQPSASDSQEEVAPWSLPAPRLIKRENQPAQTTLYVEIKLKNIHKKTGKPVAPMTGIFIPDGFKPQPAIDVILYLHGHDLAGCNKVIETYWRTKCQPHFPLREGVNAGGKNVILVTPTLGSKSESGILTQAGALDNYLDQVVAAINTHGPYAGKPQTPRIGNIILACHSGGGYPMRQIALANNRYGNQIRECWGFDCTYNTGDDTLWAQWAKRSPQAKLYIYYRPKTGTAPRAESLKRKNLPNVSVEASPKGHNQVPITYWKTRLQGAEFLKNKSNSAQAGQPEFEYEFETAKPASPSLSSLATTKFGLRKGSKRSIPVFGICVHTTGSGPASKAKKDPRKSALTRALDYYIKGDGGFPHYVVAYDGSIVATCDERQVAAHAGFGQKEREHYKTWTAPGWWSTVWNPKGARSPLDL
ncbi:MAG: hypothetical protein ABI977_09395, partial [Acidobacteriota bacterium]